MVMDGRQAEHHEPPSLKTLHNTSKTSSSSYVGNWTRQLLARQDGSARFSSWTFVRKQLYTLQLSTSRGVQPVSNILTDLSLDRVEIRFLLTSWGDASLNIYDTQAAEVIGWVGRQLGF